MMDTDNIPVVAGSYYDHEDAGRIRVVEYDEDSVSFLWPDLGGEPVSEPTEHFIENTEPADLTIDASSEDMMKSEPEMDI